MAWTELPAGQTIALHAGNAYAAVASVKSSHSRADILNIAAQHGLQVYDFAEQGERAALGVDPKTPDYRYVAIAGVAGKDASIPWQAPSLLGWVDASHIVTAWENVGGAPETPAATRRSNDAGTVIAVVVGLTAAVGGTLWWFRR